MTLNERREKYKLENPSMIEKLKEDEEKLLNINYSINNYKVNKEVNFIICKNKKRDLWSLLTVLFMTLVILMWIIGLVIGKRLHSQEIIFKSMVMGQSGINIVVLSCLFRILKLNNSKNK